ncbi:hypothetical protein HY214_04640 [Candidatus Roizmanbacteria bacterium]|nr:hypothetical protein [Candidatus Roizmanbacteria bacterium]
MGKRLFLLLISALFLMFVRPVSAFDFSRANNKFGIHLAQPNIEDLKSAADLVNANGGQWGYTTLVIQENDRNTGKWQEVFDRMRKYHLIPIIRLATEPEGGNWRRPQKAEAESWANFLDSLNWVVKERYVILFNEPNHGSEWGGEVDAQNYAETSLGFAKKLTEKNADFFVMLAGLDASAPDYRPGLEDEYAFLQTIFQVISKDDFAKYFAGLSSHSYPNPGFAGSPYGSGRISVRTYQWEVDVIRGFGVTKRLPVFITETGWSAEHLSRFQIAANYRVAFNEVWGPDEQVVAVTPFVLDYQSAPFLSFSWKQPGSSQYFPQYEEVRSLSKPAGSPAQVEKITLDVAFPKELVVNSSYHFRVAVKNDGQSIIAKEEGYSLKILDYPNGTYFFSEIAEILPKQQDDIDFYFKTGNKVDGRKVTIALMKNDRDLVEKREWTFETVPLPSVIIGVSLYPKVKAAGDDFETQIFDEKNNLLFKKTGVSVENGRGMIESIQNVALNIKYRMVILKPYYLPRQTFIVFQKGENRVTFKKMLPFDFNADGKFDGEDWLTLLRRPKLLSLFFP